jgi:hypothetical protein
MAPLFYWTLLALTCGYALVRGRSDERLAALVCIVASIATPIVLAPLAARYSEFESGEFLIDAAVLATFAFIALRSDRFWPLWIAGLQLTTSMAHLLKMVQLDLMPQAYAAAEKFWSYPILVIIAVATLRGHRRRADSTEICEAEEATA